MKNLQLPLKKEWFEMTKSGVKKEDYREINPYWCNRFLLFCNKDISKYEWERELFDYGTIEERIENIGLFCSFKNFTTNIMMLGYPKKTNTSRIIKFKHEGIEIREGNPDWGAEPGEFYFVIKHGDILK